MVKRTKQRGIDLNLNNACNLRCEHALQTLRRRKCKKTLPLEVVERVVTGS